MPLLTTDEKVKALSLANLPADKWDVADDGSKFIPRQTSRVKLPSANPIYLNPTETQVVPQKNTVSPLETVADTALDIAPSAAAGGLGAASTAALLAGMGLDMTGIGAVIGIPLTIAGGAGVGYAAHKAQKALEDNTQMGEEYKKKLAESQSTNPKSAIAGQLAAMPFGGFNPGLGGVRAVGGLTKLVTGMRPTAGEIQDIASTGINAASGAVVPFAEGERNPAELVKSAALGAIFTSPNALGKRMGFHENLGNLNPINDSVLLRTALNTTDEKETPPNTTTTGVQLNPLNTDSQTTISGIGQNELELQGKDVSAMHDYSHDLTPHGQIAAAEGEGNIIPSSDGSVRAQTLAALDPNHPRAAVLQVEGEAAPQSEYLKPVETPQGTVWFNPDKTTEDDVLIAFSQEHGGGKLLGMSTDTKPVTNPSAVAVTTRDASGNPVSDEVVKPEDISTAVAHGGNTGTVEVRAPQEVLSERIQSRSEPQYQETSALGDEVAGKLENNNLPVVPTSAWYNLLKKWGADMRGITTGQSGQLVRQDTGQPVNGMAVLQDGLRQVMINPNRAAVDTQPHEMYHVFLKDLENSPSKRDKALIHRLNELTEQSPEFRKLHPDKYTQDDVHEFSTSQQGLEFLKQQLNLGNESGMAKWWNDFKAHLNVKFGKDSSIEDVRRLVNYRFANDKSFGNKVNVGTMYQGEQSDDNKRYAEIQQKMQQAEFGTEEFAKLWKEMEEIKNKHEGKSPEHEQYQTESELDNAQLHRPVNTEQEYRKVMSETEKKQKAEEGFKKMHKAVGYQDESELNPKTGKPYSPNQQRIRNAEREAFGFPTRGLEGKKNPKFVDPRHTPPDERTPLDVKSFDKEVKDADGNGKIENAMVDTINRVANGKLNYLYKRFETATGVSIPVIQNKTGKDYLAVPNNLNRQELLSQVMQDILTHGVDTDGVVPSVRRRAAKYFDEALKKYDPTVSLNKKSAVTGNELGETIASKTLNVDENVDKEHLTSDEVAPVAEEVVNERQGEEQKPQIIEKKSKKIEMPVHDLLTALDNMGINNERLLEHLDNLAAEDENAVVDPKKLLEKFGVKLKGMFQSGSELNPTTTTTTTTGRTYKDTLPPREENPLWKRILTKMQAANDKVSAKSPELGEALNRFAALKSKLLALKDTALVDLSKIDTGTLRTVMRKHRESYRTGTEPRLSGEEKKASAVISGYFGKIADLRREFGVKINGRDAGKNKWYVPDQLNEDVIDTLVKHSQSERAAHYKHIWAEHVAKESRNDGEPVSYDEALSNINDYIGALGSADNNYNSVKFGAIRKASGYGLPESMREKDPNISIDKYGSRAASDLAMFKELESNKKIAAMLNLRDPLTGQLPKTKGLEPDLSTDNDVKAAMKWVTGSYANNNHPVVTALIRAANNGILGFGTGVRDLAQVPVNMIPYLNSVSDIQPILKGISAFRQHARMSLESGATRPNIDRVRFDQVKDSPDAFILLVQKLGDGLRKYQGREFMENLSRNITFSIGKELTKVRIMEAIGGKSSAKNWLKRFSLLVDKDITKLKNDELEQAINTTAKNFVDANQGTYDGRGLPTSIVDSQLAPFLALQKWSVEKANTIYKDVYKPFVSGENRMPLLVYTLGAVLTGAGIQELNKLLNNRKAQDPEIKESLIKGTPHAIASQLANLMMLSSYGGILGDVAKFGSDLSNSKIPRSPLAFPLASATADFVTRTVQVVGAIDSGEEPMNVLGQYALDLMTHNVQSARMLANHTINANTVEDSDKFRDLRVFNELDGTPQNNPTTSNPYSAIPVQAFKKTDDVKEAAQMIPSLVRRVVTKANESPEELKQEFDALKQNSYHTMPNPHTQPVAFSRYVAYLEAVMGKDAAEARVKDYLTHSAINRAKASMIP